MGIVVGAIFSKAGWRKLGVSPASDPTWWLVWCGRSGSRSAVHTGYFMRSILPRDLGPHRARASSHCTVSGT